VVVYWSTNYDGYTLESTTDLTPPIVWTPLTATINPADGQFEFSRDLISLKPQEFFRLRRP